jgi:AbrB family looped-hinge helix DNA binding protein
MGHDREHQWEELGEIVGFAGSDDAVGEVPGAEWRRVKVRLGDELVEWHPADLVQVKVGGKGRVVIPWPLREQLGITEGATLFVRVEGHRLILEPREAIKQRLQNEFASVGHSMAEELLDQRRRDAAREVDE